MPKFENNVLGLIPATDWLNVGFDVTRQNDPVDSLFGDLKTDNLVAEWESIASEYQIPVMAQFHGFDTEAQKTFRTPIDHFNIEKGLIKVKINQSERLRALIGRGVQNETQLYDYVLNDGFRLAEQVFTRSKVAKNELLATGKVTIKENNLDLTVDYGVAEEQTELTLDIGASAVIPDQLQAIVDAALAKGVVITGMVTSRANLTKMRKNETIQLAINGNAQAGQLVKTSAFNAYLEEEYGISRIIVNDLTYALPNPTYENGRPIITQARYFPADKITFFGVTVGNTLGTGLWGNPPEADVPQFLSGRASTDRPFVYVSQWAEKDPAVLWTKASALFMPVLYSPDSLWIATVTDGDESGEG